VANANAKTAFLELVGERHLDREFIEYVRGLRMSPSCFAVFLGLDMDLRDYPSIIMNLDEGYYLAINSNADPSLAPKGKTSIMILTAANYRDFPERGAEEYLRLKEALAEKLIEKAEKLIPDLSKHIVVMDAATPKTYERYTSMPEGAIYSFDQSIRTKRPYFKTPIRWLYLASASHVPGRRNRGRHGLGDNLRERCLRMEGGIKSADRWDKRAWRPRERRTRRIRI